MEDASHWFYPERALSYIAHTVFFRQTQQVFVCYKEHFQEHLLLKQCLAHWLCGAIKLAYVAVGVELPLNICTPPEPCLLPWLLRGMAIDDIPTEASWSSSYSFTHLYLCDVSIFSVIDSVLGLLTDQSDTVTRGAFSFAIIRPMCKYCCVCSQCSLILFTLNIVGYCSPLASYMTAL